MRGLSFTAAILILALTACSQGGTQTATPTPATQGESQSASQPAPPTLEEPPGGLPEVSANARIGFITQEYIDDNIAEIPYIEYDGERNDEIDAINRSLNQGIQREYDEFMAAYTGERDWIEIRSYPFTTEEYLQVVITSAIYPGYGSDGEMFSVNYDRKAGKWITFDDALAMEGLAADDLSAAVNQLFQPEVPTQSIDNVELAGFRVRENQRVEFLLRITVGNSEGDPWESFYSYVPEPGELSRLDPARLFDINEVDQMDPPLSYQRE